MIEALISDFFALAKIPASGTASSAIGSFINGIIQKRVEQKRVILLDEIRAGEIPLEKLSDDEFVSSVWRIHFAIIQGAGNANIKLLAKVLVGLLQTGKEIYADEFLHYSVVLEGLSQNEITLLGTFCINQEEYDSKNDKEKEALPNPFMKTQEQLVEQKVFANKDEFLGCCASVSRTGLLLPKSGWGMLVYSVSPQMIDLQNLIKVNISEILK